MAKPEDIPGWLDDIEGSGWWLDRWEVGKLRKAVDEALTLPPPKGDLVRLQALIDDYQRASNRLHDVYEDLKVLARRGIPEVWIGGAGAMASETVVAAYRSLARINNWYGYVCDETGGLSHLRNGIRWAQLRHGEAMTSLNEVREVLSGMSDFDVRDVLSGKSDFDAEVFNSAREKALGAVTELQRGEERAKSAAENFVQHMKRVKEDVNDVGTDRLDAAGSLVLGDTRRTTEPSFLRPWRHAADHSQWGAAIARTAFSNFSAWSWSRVRSMGLPLR
ncbi:hypothetical protein GCM10022226_07340 [Sphaerisporangium flaviroseum]|uniref:WXG100 family type VII secretion target n=1 Tax=Sphaerisporangium flaviroseum TaxID=509199 RepID=A0ABP7HC96_9ACTN